ncbi:MAG: hypothetical protein P8171_15250 [Candidatus Thiodiazotropha sp.]|jgi:hypothetical protein
MWKRNFSLGQHFCWMLTLVTALFAGGCSKPYLPPTIEKPTQASSNRFDGLLTLLEKHGALHVLWIHGMCPHNVKDWAEPRVNAVMKRLGIEGPSAIASTSIGEFIYRYELDYQGKPITLDMVVWSELIAERRAELCFDSVKEDSGMVYQACGDRANYPYRRAKLNNALKSGLLNACLADAMIYIGGYGRVVRDKLRPEIEAALAPSPDGTKPAVLLMSESLGSKVMFDTIQQIMGNRSKSLAAAGAVSTLQNTVQIMMFANQIPMLDLADSEPARVSASWQTSAGEAGSSLHGFVGALRKISGQKLKEAEKIDRLKVVAFSDPNDVLSYRLPNDYFPSSWRTDVINVIPSNDYVWFWLFENPLTAHQGYSNTDEVFDLFLCGNPPDETCVDQ